MCAPDLAQEAAVLQAQAAVEQLSAKMREVDQVFCPECGERRM